MTAAREPVLDLGAIRAADAARVGPKMARLGQLAAAGWRVPDGYAVTAAALDGWLPATARADLERLFTGPGAPPGDAGQGELARLGGQAQELIEAQPLPSWLADSVGSAHQRLAERTGRGTRLAVAVRSSAVGEDGHAASFAGQYETYLGVRGIGEVLAHIRRCWASGYSAHALRYRQRFGGSGPLYAHDLAVGIVELVDVRSAGVAFTLDPVTGDRGTVVVEGNWGFGDSVVSGHVSPDHWRVDRASGQVLTARVGAKRSWSVLRPGTGLVRLEPLPGELAARACLAEHEVRYICEQAVRIEEAEGVPQDVEWAVARGLPFPDSVFFLQHRPETTWPTADPEAADPEAAGPGGGDPGGGDPGSGDPGSAGPGAAGPAGFDPVRYALRNVFRVPGS